MNDISAANYTQVVGAAITAAKLQDIAYSKITVHNPTAASFQDFGIDKGGDRIIPVTNVYDATTVKPNSGQTHADALLLKIEVRYCAELVIPVVDELILMFNSDPACLYLGEKRVPIVSQAVVRITVPPSRKALL